MSTQFPPWQHPFPQTFTHNLSAMPAYNAVPDPRQSFGYQNTTAYSQPLPPPPSLAPQATAPTKTKITWPQSVRDYVARAFDPTNMMEEVSRIQMEHKLKATISAATDAGTLHSIDWNSYPLPQKLIKEEQLHAAWQQTSVQLLNGNAYQNGSFNTPSKKRKSNDMSDIPDETAPPWRNTNHQNAFESRITFSPAAAPNQLETRTKKFADTPLKGLSKSKTMDKRQRKFDGGYVSSYRSPTPESNNGPVVGRCQVLEKRYLRLTAAPKPEDVRPLAVLKKTMDLLKKKWKTEGNYSYICDQFKSLRQDLTVQHIKDKFTVEVYEIHARIALEKGDLGEYNQCQTQLRALYAQNLGGNPVEFKAYRILYFIHTCNRTALNDVLASLTIAEKEESPIKHALNVRSALALGNYHRFFRLYLSTPNMGAYLMDMFVVRERLAALSNICKSYKPSVSLRFITEELGFESDSDAATFIIECNGQDLLEEKDDGIVFQCGKAGALFETAKQAAFRKVDIKGQI